MDEKRYLLTIDLLPEYKFTDNSLIVLKTMMLPAVITKIKFGEDFTARIFDVERDCFVYTLRGTRVKTNSATFTKISESINKYPMKRDLCNALYR